MAAEEIRLEEAAVIRAMHAAETAETAELAGPAEVAATSELG